MKIKIEKMLSGSRRVTLTDGNVTLVWILSDEEERRDMASIFLHAYEVLCEQ